MKRISEKLIIVEKEKKVKKLDMPIYVGKAVLDFSKHLMYDFFYNVVMKHYHNARLCYTDTDSFIIEFPDKLQGFTDFVLKNKDHFDLSRCLNKNHPLYHHLEGKKTKFRNNKGYNELSEEEKNALYRSSGYPKQGC